MKIVIISDIHANMEALTALPEKFDELWVLGDLVNYGPNPAEVVEFVRAKATLIVRGNHDHAIGFGENTRCSPSYREMAEATSQYTNEVLTESQKQFLRDLPLRAQRVVDGVHLSLCHAAPSDPLFAYCPPDSPQWETEAGPNNAELLLVGHTHLQFDRQVGGHRVVNPGSLGQSKMGAPAACYAVLENGIVDLHTSEYPFEKTIQKISALPIAPDLKTSLARVLRHGGLAESATPEGKEYK